MEDSTEEEEQLEGNSEMFEDDTAEQENIEESDDTENTDEVQENPTREESLEEIFNIIIETVESVKNVELLDERAILIITHDDIQMTQDGRSFINAIASEISIEDIVYMEEERQEGWSVARVAQQLKNATNTDIALAYRDIISSDDWLEAEGESVMINGTSVMDEIRLSVWFGRLLGLSTAPFQYNEEYGNFGSPKIPEDMEKFFNTIVRNQDEFIRNKGAIDLSVYPSIERAGQDITVLILYGISAGLTALFELSPYITFRRRLMLTKFIELQSVDAVDFSNEGEIRIHPFENDVSSDDLSEVERYSNIISATYTIEGSED